ncbi:MAG: hypothetical protein SF052_26005 [Bacteroidia bacterium]|nr:hypothetical protein [Bacteroidia bacterium]
MKTLKVNPIIALALSLFMFIGMGLSYAQEIVVISETESVTISTYHIKYGDKFAKVTVKKETGKVGVKLESKNGELLGKATVEQDANGDPIINLIDVRPGTMDFWIFALDRIIPDNNGPSLSPRQKAYLKCKDKCKDWVTSHEGFQILTLSNGTNTIPVVKLEVVKKALEAYQKCMWRCLHEAKDRNQN